MSDQKPNLPGSVEKPYPGVVREWYRDQSIVLYRLTGVTHEAVENWEKAVLETLRDWDKSTPYLAIHDLSQPGVSLQFAALVNFDMMNIGITMSGRELAEAYFDEHESFNALIAINFNLSLSGQTNRTLMNFLNRDHPSIRYKTFYNRNKCLRWLSNGGVSDTSELRAVKPDDDQNTSSNSTG